MIKITGQKSIIRTCTTPLLSIMHFWFSFFLLVLCLPGIHWSIVHIFCWWSDLLLPIFYGNFFLRSFHVVHFLLWASFTEILLCCLSPDNSILPSPQMTDVFFFTVCERFTPTGPPLSVSAHMSQEIAERLLQWLQDSLLTESQQPSVRYQQEWLLSRLLYHHLHLRDRLWDMFQQVGMYTNNI